MWEYYNEKSIDRLCFVCGGIIMKNGHHILAVLKEAMSQTFERSTNLLENVKSSNICHSCWTQRCPLFRGVRYSEDFILRFCINFCRSKKMCPLLASPLLRAFTVLIY